MAKSAKTSGRKSTSARSNSAKSASRKSSNGRSKSRSSSNGEESTKDHEELMKLFEHGLKDMFWVEKALTRAIPKMIKKATSEELIQALEEHLTVTEDQIEKLERVFEAIEKTPRAKKCIGMAGILEEGVEIMEEMSQYDESILDAAIISAASKVEHYEMSTYISLISLAEMMDMVKEADILQEILEEEMEADELLTNLSISILHTRAISQD